MLQIDIDLVPFGHSYGRKTIGRIVIANDGKLDIANEMYHDWYKYNGWVFDGEGALPQGSETLGDPHVTVHHRRDHGAIVLLDAVLLKWFNGREG